MRALPFRTHRLDSLHESLGTHLCVEVGKTIGRSCSATSGHALIPSRAFSAHVGPENESLVLVLVLAVDSLIAVWVIVGVLLHPGFADPRAAYQHRPSSLAMVDDGTYHGQL